MKKILVALSIACLIVTACDNDSNSSTTEKTPDFKPTPHDLTGTWNEEESLKGNYTEKFIFIGFFFVPNNTYTYIDSQTNKNYSGDFLFDGYGQNIFLTNFDGKTININYVRITPNKIYLSFNNEVKTFIRE